MQRSSELLRDADGEVRGQVLTVTYEVLILCAESGAQCVFSLVHICTHGLSPNVSASRMYLGLSVNIKYSGQYDRDHTYKVLEGTCQALYDTWCVQARPTVTPRNPHYRVMCAPPCTIVQEASYESKCMDICTYTCTNVCIRTLSTA